MKAPSDVQQSGDFASDQTTASAEQELISASSFEGIDWGRFRGFRRPSIQQKRHRPLTNHLWRFGWRLHKSSVLVCRLCHTRPSNPRKPAGSSFVCDYSTTSAVKHLKKVHRVGSSGPNIVPRSQPSTSSRGQSTMTVTSRHPQLKPCLHLRSTGAISYSYSQWSN